MLAASARDVVERVKQYQQDRLAISFDDDEYLTALDQALEEVATRYRLSRQGYNRDMIEVNTSAFTKVSEFWYEYAGLPETVGSVEVVELYDGRTRRYRPIEQSNFTDLLSGFSPLYPTTELWSHTTGGFPGSIALAGIDVPNTSRVRIWFSRAIPPMHFTAIGAPGVTVSSTTTAVLPNTGVSGSLIARNDVYTRSSILFETTGQLVTVTAYDGATRTVTFPALSAAPTGSYSLMVPMSGRHIEYVTLMAAYKMALRLGQNDYIRSFEDAIKRADMQFREDTNTRNAFTPDTWRSNRR